MTHHKMRVSCKAALFTPDRHKVLLTAYGSHGYGLPGGHIDDGETPDQAMSRELFEELGVKDIELERKDFWMHHSNPKLILGYAGVLDESFPLVIQEEEISAAVWVPVDKIKDGSVKVPSYDKFILKLAYSQSLRLKTT